MTTENPKEGNPQGEGDESANSTSSPAQGQLSAENLAALNTRLQAQSDEITSLKKQVSAFQSGKDKRYDRVEAQLAKYLNIPPEKVEEAQRSMVLDELVNERLGKPVAQDSGTAPAPEATVEMQTLVTELGLTMDDVQVNTLLKRGGSTTQLAVELGKLAIAKSKQPNITSAQEPASTSGGAPASKLSDADIDKKARELTELYKRPTQAKARIEQLEKELEGYLPGG